LSLKTGAIGEIILEESFSPLFDGKTGKDALPESESLSSVPRAPGLAEFASPHWDAVFCQTPDKESCSYSSSYFQITLKQ
jgi:hypothetical protein